MFRNLFSLSRSELVDYSSIPFWSWNGELNKEQLLKQISEMNEVGIYGFIMHARTGLSTEYMGNDWFESIQACLDQAKKLNMKAWVYDENGWPSGFVGGKLLEKSSNLAKYLSYKVLDHFDNTAFKVYKLENGEPIEITENDIAGEYHTLYIVTDKSNTDILQSSVVDQFIEQTYEVYYKKFSEYFGKELAGFFTDEPQYFRYATPYSIAVDKPYLELTGKDLAGDLIHLFLDTKLSRSVRYNYYTVLSNLYKTNFYKKIYDWCESHNVMFTGHSIEETTLFTQMWCSAGVMVSYEYEHIPGIDWLGKNVGSPLSPKQLGSVREQLGKKFALTETFGCSGYDVTPRELKFVADFQYLNGVNKMCQHLMMYTIKGQGKIDHPPTFSKHTPWWNDYKIFNDYYNRLGYLMANSKETVNTLVFHPIRSAFATYNREKDFESIKEIENDFADTVKNVTNKGISYHFGDEGIMQNHAKVVGDTLVIGNCSYKYLVLPKFYVLTDSTTKLFKEFVANGGKIINLNELETEYNWLASSLNLSDIPVYYKLKTNGESMSITYRQSEFGKFVMVANTSKTENLIIELDTNFSDVNLETCTFKPADNKFIVKPQTTKLLFETTEGTTELISEADSKIDVPVKVISTTKNIAVFDRVTIKTENDTKFSQESYIHAVNEKFIKAEYQGKMSVKYTFNSKFIPNNLTLRFEKFKSFELFVNGTKVNYTNSDWDFEFGVADISKLVVVGENEIVFEIDYYQDKIVRYAMYDESVTESLKNCLSINTLIEPIHLIGDFVLNKARTICPYALPTNPAQLETQGFDNFAGQVNYEGTLPKGTTKIEIEGNYTTASLFIDGKLCGKSVLSTAIELSQPLSLDTQFTLVLTSSLRNLLGPHHNKHFDDNNGVSPGIFTMYGSWDNNESYTEDFILLPFGINKITATK